MKRSIVIAIAICAAIATGTARADVVTDWNQTAIEVMKVAKVGGNPWSRALAMVHVAMSDAINSVQNRYTRYMTTVPAAPGASAEAAAAAAARQILASALPRSENHDRGRLREFAQGRFPMVQRRLKALRWASKSLQPSRQTARPTAPMRPITTGRSPARVCGCRRRSRFLRNTPGRSPGC